MSVLQWVLRGVVFLAGGLMAAVGVSMWLDPAGGAASLGVMADSPFGLATLRADLGAFFLTIAGFAILAAVLNRAHLLTAPLVLIALALAGRAATGMTDGFDQDMIRPMIVEGVLTAIFLAGRFGLAKQTLKAAA